MQWNTRHNGVVLSSVFMKLGILVPTVLSVIWFKEMPNALQLIGFLLAVLAIVILNFQRGTKLSRASWGLLLMLVVGGMGDGMSKIYEEYGSSTCKNLFLFFTFFCALLLCLGLVRHRKERIGGKELLYAAQGIISRTYESMFPLMGVACVYLVLVMLFTWLRGKLERRLRKGDLR